jgi:TusA-related sulfurtransferase
MPLPAGPIDSAGSAAAVAIDAGDLSVGSGLLSLVRPALDVLAPGGMLAVLSRSSAVAEDLPSWCRAERHQYLGREPIAGGLDRHLIARGTFSVPHGTREQSLAIEGRDGRPTSAAMLAAVPMPGHASVDTGFAPRGARVEPGGPAYPFSLTERDHVAPPDVAKLYDQAVAAQWDANRDIPWQTVRPLAPPLEHAVGQIMTFLAENELSALYLPSRFIAQIHPAFAEVAMFLASQLADEARHIDVFLKRARFAGGGLGISSVTTSRSLLSLLETRDFTEAAFLLSVLGEGTFLDLLTYIETHAPDEATAELVRRARADESRHVHFGLSHVRWALQHDAGLFARLQETVRRRAATLAGVGGVPAPVQDALTVLAAGSAEPKAIARGHDAFRELLMTMHHNRLKRLEHAGFSLEQAETISGLHTPNFM